MNVKEQSITTLDYTISFVLRVGLSISVLLILIGGIGYLWESPSLFQTHASVKNGTNASFSITLIDYGIRLLILTPAMRVFACLVIFAKERDFLYVAFASFILAVLLYK
jgi:uncharacterized membrane protein